MAAAAPEQQSAADTSFTEALFDDDEQDDGQEGDKRQTMFTKELRCMMYGFGDDKNPFTETVGIMEDLVVEYVTEMTKKAMDVGRQGKLSVEDVIYIIRKDPKKYSRCKDLLIMNEELRKARKAFDEVKYVGLK